MFLTHLSLKNYRNYISQELSFTNKVNVILGENAQGKTNLMEAIYVLAMAKSHRTSNDKELIRWDEEYAKIEGKAVKKNGPSTLQLVISKKGKKAKISHIEQKKLSQYIGHINVVLFAPEDLHLVKGGPQVRRRFIDMEMGQISPVYMHDLSRYQKILQQRNHYLKLLQTKQHHDEAVLDVLTEQLIEIAAKITLKRYEFSQLLQKWAEPIHHEISRGLEKLQIQYHPSVQVSEELELSRIIEAYTEKFVKIKEKEIQRGTTLAGPHRDDLSFDVNGRDVQTFGSQGQQRTTALSIKLAEIELIFSETGDYPILLLDDVLSELDDFRQTHLLNTIRQKVQTFVTTTSIDGIKHDVIKEAAIYQVSSGHICSPDTGDV
ncbi:DNA replication and repair protein RecF [Anoxybacillus sp. P3H1B]|uniref:DNA replication/repair protein RecF n=1 Tax=Anoxybacillaceae TaxID=3120669 RepID=UPI0007959A56|nr:MULTISPECIES: DNA replication/repair protein RecF [Anoxybacillus]KXG08640.1 DNA replication and repair protein RecF [Anoxybacillus sp. P3H1B]MBB3908177.1 DNA replication and repair protein RecF [Anoxybacillus rupiensis]MBS2772304.1 DNA replication/repair protein RecF [Anoxybacillus rupiensis]